MSKSWEIRATGENNPPIHPAPRFFFLLINYFMNVQEPKAWSCLGGGGGGQGSSSKSVPFVSCGSMRGGEPAIGLPCSENDNQCTFRGTRLVDDAKIKPHSLTPRLTDTRRILPVHFPGAQAERKSCSVKSIRGNGAKRGRRATPVQCPPTLYSGKTTSTTSSFPWIKLRIMHHACLRSFSRPVFPWQPKRVFQRSSTITLSPDTYFAASSRAAIPTLLKFVFQLEKVRLDLGDAKGSYEEQNARVENLVAENEVDDVGGDDGGNAERRMEYDEREKRVVQSLSWRGSEGVV